LVGLRAVRKVENLVERSVVVSAGPKDEMTVGLRVEMMAVLMVVQKV
jgi:hypothetical protein